MSQVLVFKEHGISIDGGQTFTIICNSEVHTQCVKHNEELVEGMCTSCIFEGE